jgi:hypothetical protein
MIFGKSKLEKKLDTWILEGGNLYELLRSEMNQPVSSRADAKAVCRALDVVREKGNSAATFASTLHHLTGFFQPPDDQKAMEVFATVGLPRLRMWVHDLLAGEDVDEDSVMFILKILAKYRQREDVDLVARAARLPNVADRFMWSTIFDEFDSDHPYSNQMIDALRDPLPLGFVLVGYLDMANTLAIAGKLDFHPFDSNAGCEQLERFLQDKNEDNSSYAVSATAAIPFIGRTHRERLLSTAFEHADSRVRIEAAWAQAKSGDKDGFSRLAELCLDPRLSHTAQLYLNELRRSDLIPEEVSNEEFRAVAEMANWLAHPGELGSPPDSVVLFDTRELFWPPTNDKRRLFLVKYSAAGEDGVGLVGSVTFALFGETTADMSPEEIYSVHCCWELEMNGDRRAPDERTAEAGKEILAKYNSSFS